MEMINHEYGITSAMFHTVAHQSKDLYVSTHNRSVISNKTTLEKSTCRNSIALIDCASHIEMSENKNVV